MTHLINFVFAEYGYLAVVQKDKASIHVQPGLLELDHE
jgi:hypothetical protein